jgi:hypothetical protein
MEEDPTRNLLRRSILWPLGTYERRGDQAWAHVFPLYWHSEEPGQEWTFTVPLYLKSVQGDSAWHHLFPLFSRHVIGDYYASNFVLGPFLITTSDTRTDLTQWDLIFPLFHYRRSLDSSNSWLFPFYWSGEDPSKGEAYRYILPLYGSSDDPSQHYHFLFPFYGYADNTSAQVKRLAILGLPPAKGFSTIPSLALFEHVTTADETSHRIFPLYSYASGADGSSTFDALLLYRHQAASFNTIDRFFPLYRYEGNADGQSHEFNLLGYREASWFHYQDNPDGTQHRLLGLYNYDHSRDGSVQLSALGYRRLSLYLHRSQDDLTEDRLVPLYDYFQDGNNRALSLIGMSDIAGIEPVSVPTSPVSALSIPARSREGRDSVRRPAPVSPSHDSTPSRRPAAPLLGLHWNNCQDGLAVQFPGNRGRGAVSPRRQRHAHVGSPVPSLWLSQGARRRNSTQLVGATAIRPAGWLVSL